ncbi:ribonuclease H-like domain-containing protein [Robertmurraya sp. Marseille-Q9965]
MSFRKKLNRLKPHLSTEPEVKVEDTKNFNEIPYLEQWKAEEVSPYYYDNHYCFVREKEFSIDQQYGNYTFAQFRHAVQAWNNSTFQHPLSSKGFAEGQLFFFDTETTGLGGGVGNTIFLLGYASFKEDKVVLRQHFLPNPSGEVPLYQSFLENIDYTTLVTYNGKAFDWPQVKTRHTLIREHVPKLPSFGHFDLFHAARRLWKHKLERLKLSIVEKEVLGVQRVEDVPGFLAPMIYFDFVESGKPDGMIGILKHNEMDILSLITLYTHLTFQLLNIDARRTTTEGYEVGRWYAALGDTHAATETLTLAANGDEKDSLKAKLALSYERKKQKEWEKALLLWKELADISNKNIAMESCIELAKYFEHREKNIDEAIAYCEKAMAILQEKMKIWRTEKQPHMEELEKRLKRLKRKSSK